MKTKNVRTRKKVFEGQNIGSWFKYHKNKITSIEDDDYKKLSINKYVKDKLDIFLKKNE